MRRHVLGLIHTRESPRKRYGRRLNGLATLASARLSCPWRLGPVSVVSNPSIAERADKVVRIIVDTYVLANWFVAFRAAILTQTETARR